MGATFRGLYPEPEGIYRLVFASNDQALFDSQGRLRALLTPRRRTLYEYDGEGRLTSLSLTGEGPEVQVRFERDGQGRISAAVTGQDRVGYEYDTAGDLVNVRVEREAAVGYRYDKRHLLS